MMIKQCVVRTKPSKTSHWLCTNPMGDLSKKLDNGWIVVMCNQIENDLEYILKKEVKDNDTFYEKE